MDIKEKKITYYLKTNSNTNVLSKMKYNMIIFDLNFCFILARPASNRANQVVRSATLDRFSRSESQEREVFSTRDDFFNAKKSIVFNRYFFTGCHETF